MILVEPADVSSDNSMAAGSFRIVLFQFPEKVLIKVAIKMHRLFKRAVYGVFIVAAVPLWLLYRLQSLLLGARKSFEGYSQLVSLFPGMPGNYLRWAFYRLTKDGLGEDTCICFGTTLADPSIRIGKGVYIGPFCNLGLCTIEDDVLLGTGVHIISGFTQHTTPISRLRFGIRRGACATFASAGIRSERAIVGNDVGTKCVIGAASLVVHEIPPYFGRSGKSCQNHPRPPGHILST